MASAKLHTRLLYQGEILRDELPPGRSDGDCDLVISGHQSRFPPLTAHRSPADGHHGLPTGGQLASLGDDVARVARSSALVYIPIHYPGARWRPRRPFGAHPVADMMRTNVGSASSAQPCITEWPREFRLLLPLPRTPRLFPAESGHWNQPRHLDGIVRRTDARAAPRSSRKQETPRRPKGTGGATQ